MPTKRKTTKRKKAAKIGRPAVTFDLEQLESLCGIGCPDYELADWFGCSIETIKKRKKDDPAFLAAHKKGWSTVRGEIRKLQIEKAKAGNTTMLIWLGKILLYQREDAIPDIEEAPEDLVMGVDLGGNGDNKLIIVKPGSSLEDMRAGLGMDTTPPKEPEDVADTRPEKS